MKKIRIPLLLSIALVCITLYLNNTVLMPTAIQVDNQAEGIRETQLYAKSAVLLDADSGRILYEKNGYEQMPMASTTKIMTCILALEYGDPEDLVEVSAYAAGMPKVKLGIHKGEKYRLKDLLYALMLESDNDAAVAIAEHITAGMKGKHVAEFGPEESKAAVLEFAELMNQKAQELGCANTYFITPNGLDATLLVTDEDGNQIQKTHSTTAADLAQIMRYCIELSVKKEEFLEITRMPSHSFTNLMVNEDGSIAYGKRRFSCNNHNAFLQMMEGALSGKTGFTNNAGYCYVGALKKDGKTFIVALLASGWPNNKNYKWSDTKILMNYGLSNYEYKKVKIGTAPKQGEESTPDVWEEIVFKPIPVKGGIPASGRLEDTAYTNVALQMQDGEETLSVLMGEEECIRVSLQKQEILEAPVAAGSVVGTLTYSFENELDKTYQVVTKDEVNKITYIWCLKKIMTMLAL